MKKTKSNTEAHEDIMRLGRGIQLELDAHFKAWETGLPFKKIFGKYAAVARKHSMCVNEFAYAIQEAGFVRIICSPAGNRYAFAASCVWSEDQMTEHLHQLDFEERERRTAKREARRAHA